MAGRKHLDTTAPVPLLVSLLLFHFSVTVYYVSSSSSSLSSFSLLAMIIMMITTAKMKSPVLMPSTKTSTSSSATTTTTNTTNTTITKNTKNTATQTNDSPFRRCQQQQQQQEQQQSCKRRRQFQRQKYIVQIMLLLLLQPLSTNIFQKKINMNDFNFFIITSLLFVSAFPVSSTLSLSKRYSSIVNTMDTTNSRINSSRSTFLSPPCSLLSSTRLSMAPPKGRNNNNKKKKKNGGTGASGSAGGGFGGAGRDINSSTTTATASGTSSTTTTTTASNNNFSTIQSNKGSLSSTRTTTTTIKSNQNHDNDIVYRKDYQEPPYWITNVFLDFNIVHTEKVIVTSTMTICPNNNNDNKNTQELFKKEKNEDLIMNGDGNTLSLQQVSILCLEHNNINTDDNNNNKNKNIVLQKDKDYQVFNDSLLIKGETIQTYCCNSNNSNNSDDFSAFQLQTIVELSSFQQQQQQQQQKQQTSNELSGLYQRNGIFFTHCEPTGFRKISYFLDRPDNTAIFHVRIESSKMEYPFLLSNGNLMEFGTVRSTEENNSITNTNDEDDDRHYVLYQDPYPKPCYIFALIAAPRELECITDTYTTKSGKQVQLRIYNADDVQQHPQQPNGSLSKLQFALDSLKRSMEWDETTYGLEYDLNVYNIIASQHFVIGAMENKGLNIFQTSLIATNPHCTTDVTYDLVEKTIAHEYFHNWSGNRVTIQNWFEFALKEGLTVYRDQEFTSDIGLRTVTRIEAVKILREKQFQEDASPITRHPIRPESAAMSREHELDALASSTTYHKGAEVCRMYKSILGKEGFKKGLQLYMKRHDGTAATCDDFRKAMADANNNINLDQFALWYSTAGTPIVSYKYSYDANRQTFFLTLSQSLKESSSLSLEHQNHDGDADNDDDVLLHIPVAVGLLDKSTGKEVVPTTTLELKDRTQTFEFPNLENDVVPSILRDFSAPVILLPENDNDSDNNSNQQDERLSFLATYDTDGFNRWEAIQALYASCIFKIMRHNDDKKNEKEENDNNDNTTLEGEGGGVEELVQQVLKAFEYTLKDPNIDPASRSYLLNLPTESILSRQLQVENPVGVYKARQELGRRINDRYYNEIRHLYDEITTASIANNDENQNGQVVARTDTMSRATRSLRNVLLDFLCYVKDYNENENENDKNTIQEKQIAAAALAMNHFDTATCLTDKLAAFRKLSSMTGTAAAAVSDAREEGIQKFYQYAKNDIINSDSNSGSGGGVASDMAVVVLNKWFQTQALSELPDALDRVKALTRHVDFKATNAGRFRSLITSFTMNSRAFHCESGDGYAFIGSICTQIDRVAPTLAIELANKLAPWRRHDPKRGALMKAELKRIASTKNISKGLALTVQRALK